MASINTSDKEFGLIKNELTYLRNVAIPNLKASLSTSKEKLKTLEKQLKKEAMLQVK
jgi:5-bromo-4-chloroindolyl phosphate hydrolysis protein